MTEQPDPQPRPRRIFGRPSTATERNLMDTLRTEKAGGVLLLIGAVAALVFANTPAREEYLAVRDTVLGPASLHLDLTIAQWATDGLLAIFFFVVGLELKREFVAGDLRRPATAIAPMAAAVGGMAAPALIYLVINTTQAGGATAGWAVPTATDIAFAVAVLAVVGSALPPALRMFLLTLAVVDDLLAITVIAIFYTEQLTLGYLAAALAVIALFGLAVRSRRVPPLVLVVLGVVAWALMHSSGIHATIAGVLLGFMVPALDRNGEGTSLAERYEHAWRPVSAGFVVPVFALFAAGVALDPATLSAAAADPVAQGAAAGLVLGKPIGIMLTTALIARITRSPFARGVSWWDVLGMSGLAGIGFTVSLLVGELAFTAGSPQAEHVKAGVLIGSLVSALLGALVLLRRGRHYRRIHAAFGQHLT